MSAAVTLELLRCVIDEHERQMDHSELAVIRCLHDSADTDEDAALIAAAMQRAGGRYFRCHIDAAPVDHPGPLNTALARQLEQRARLRGIDLAITATRDGVQVTIGGSTKPTGAAALVAQVFAMLCSQSMDAELVAYSYTLAELDEPSAALLWEAASAVAQFHVEPLQTLVPIACGPVDVAKHCDPREDTVRFAIRGEDLVRRQPRREPDARVNRILLDIKDPVVLFLGAGASASAHIPQGNRLRDMSIAALTGLKETSGDLVQAFRRHLEANPGRYLSGEQQLTPTQFEAALTLERVLREEFQQLSGRPRADAPTVKRLTTICAEALHREPPGRQAIRDLAALLPRLIIATVNFDELIEDGMPVPCAVVASSDDFAAVHASGLVTSRIASGGSTLPVLKVHGTISRPDTLVADIETTTRGLAKPIADVLTQVVASAGQLTWVWIGCSMRDLDLRQWLKSTTAASMIEYWVDPLPAPSVAEYAKEVRRREWALDDQTLQDRQITESADVFLPLLVERARTLVGGST